VTIILKKERFFMPSEYENAMAAIKDAQGKKRRSLVADGELSEETVEKLGDAGYAVILHTYRYRDKPQERKTIIAWGNKQMGL
jgi:hypothetical protein